MSCANEHAPPKRKGEKSKDPRPDTPDQALQNPPHCLRFSAGEAPRTVDSQRL